MAVCSYYSSTDSHEEMLLSLAQYLLPEVSLICQQGWIQDFLREGASQAEITDIESQKFAEELPYMHASPKLGNFTKLARHDWLTALKEYFTVLLEYLNLFAI